jgi:DNA-binding transcriptional regulator YiaG
MKIDIGRPGLPRAPFNYKAAVAKRQALGITRPALARTLGVNYNTLAGWELGSQKPPDAAVRAMAKLFRCKVEALR